MDYWDEKGNKKGHVQPVPYTVDLKDYLAPDLETKEHNPFTKYDLFAVIAVNGKTFESMQYSALVKRKIKETNKGEWKCFKQDQCLEVPDDMKINP